MTTTNPPSDGVARDLENAATLLRERGWCQGGFTNAAGAHCLLGALGHVSDGIGGARWEAGRTALYFYLGTHTPSLSFWNDEPDRSAEEVITALESAAALARASGEAS